MLTLAHPWLLILLPLPWLLRILLPPRRVSQAAVRVPFGRRLRRIASVKASGAISSKPAKRFLVPTLLWLILLGAL
ncbi:MAG: hypothetical protein KDM63_17195, partial [Verrucomicrobiae bacterium]|nr:hypothetical protein [Verrucomicrobiae bacterium]